MNLKRSAPGRSERGRPLGSPERRRENGRGWVCGGRCARGSTLRGHVCWIMFRVERSRAQTPPTGSVRGVGPSGRRRPLPHRRLVGQGRLGRDPPGPRHRHRRGRAAHRNKVGERRRAGQPGGIRTEVGGLRCEERERGEQGHGQTSVPESCPVALIRPHGRYLRHGGLDERRTLRRPFPCGLLTLSLSVARNGVARPLGAERSVPIDGKRKPKYYLYVLDTSG